MAKQRKTLTQWPKAAYAWPDFSYATQKESSSQLQSREALMDCLVKQHGQDHGALHREMHAATCDAPGMYRRYQEASFLRRKLDALISENAQS
jgi:hypothetical protein